MTGTNSLCENRIDADAASRLAVIDCGRMAYCDNSTVAMGIDSVRLMEQAAQGVVSSICERWSARPVTILCGPGNNGGDGYAVGWILRDLGWPVRVFALGTPVTDDARYHAERWGHEVSDLAGFEPQSHDLVVDALFGAGLVRPLQGAAVQALAQCVNRQVQIVAIDIPSGVHGDSGQIWGFAAAAAVTVSFTRPKPGHLLLPGRKLCGELLIKDIGVTDSLIAACQPDCWHNDPALWQELLPSPGIDDHKYSRGHVLLVGSARMSGAIRLAARAVRRVGAGVVTVAAPAEALPLYGVDQPGVLLSAIEGGAGLTSLLEDRRINQLVIGPGLGRDAWARSCALAALAAARPMVLDADLFNLFAGAADSLARFLRAPAVMTPHLGEFERVFGSVGNDRMAAARRASALTGAVIVLKGADSIVAHPDGRAIVNDHACAYLATAGSGDVLAGLIAGLMAQGMPVFEAAAAGVWLHGAAGRFCGRGLIAEDLPEAIAKIWPTPRKGVRP